MLIKTAELKGDALDWAVAKCEGVNPEISQFESGEILFGFFIDFNNYSNFIPYSPSRNWLQGGDIIERSLIQINPKHHNETISVNPRPFLETIGWHWESYILGPENIDDNHYSFGDTPLVAAMRCYVSSKLGNEVDIPEELNIGEKCNANL